MWHHIKEELPEEGIYVETKIDDDRGCRNQYVLRQKGNLWFLPDGMYVYYTPTHWRYLWDDKN